MDLFEKSGRNSLGDIKFHGCNFLSTVVLQYKEYFFHPDSFAQAFF